VTSPLEPHTKLGVGARTSTPLSSGADDQHQQWYLLTAAQQNQANDR